MHEHLCVCFISVVTLAACTGESPAEESGETIGDGDGDGDPSGDGDGDGSPECSCEPGGSFEQCGVVDEPLTLSSTFTWPEGLAELALDELCPVTAVADGPVVTLDCPAGVVSIGLTLDPVWAPALAPGELVRVRASESAGMAEGDDWPHLRWRLDLDGQLLASYLSGASLVMIDDPFAAQIQTGLCEPTCTAEAKVEPVAVQFAGESDELILFGGQTATLDDHRFVVATAADHNCTDGNPGDYRVAIIHEPPPADACALVDGQTYSSQEQLECGLGPNGPELCNWTVSFAGGQYDWNYSDIGESDEYACSGLELLSVPEASALGTVSPDGALLTWDGVLYDRN